MQIPAFDGYGNKPERIDNEEVFMLMANHIVDQSVYISTQADIRIAEDFHYRNNPDQVMYDGLQEWAGQQSVPEIRYRVFCAFFGLWNETYEHEDGAMMRENIQKDFLRMRKENDQLAQIRSMDRN